MKIKSLSLALGTLLLGAVSSAQAVEDAVLKNIETRVGAIESKLIGWRRDIHQNPELSNQEVRTAKLVADHLRSLGLEVKTGVGGTGVVGILKGGKPGKVVALRADMDALPVKELVDLPFASKAKGKHMGKEVDVAHACGHDAHTAILMATAEVLAGMRDQIPGTVKFLFQPAEEGPSEALKGEHDHIGALAMVDAGALDNPKVDAVFGLHMIPAFPVGTIGYRSGPILASGDTFTIKVNGKQTHGGFPWNGVDPIVSTSQIVLGLQTIVSRQLNLTKEPAVISIGSIHGGNRENIIPESVELLGTVRTFDDGMRDDTLARMRTTAESIAQASGAKAEVNFLKPGYSTTVNNADLSARMLPTMQQVTGGKAVITPKLTASEDFSEFSKKVPGVFFFLGSSTPGKEKTAAPNHSPKFEIDEASLAVGAKAMTAMALDFLGQP
ncbi:amidohydrolase [Thauera sp. 2A1]|uniref:amidohydrolase n=1 Tax=Thauera sp. 2A1 TaxID=2570191 RepID=UPI001291023B|nr:amidohydrolase [Thauera sp. 2A1]KAI5915846.1 amidohydrolase [Thauera sp. 2A1]